MPVVPPTHLEDLLSSLFEAAQLRQFLRRHGPPTAEVVDELPGEAVAKATLMHEAALALGRAGLANRALFEALVEKFPGRREDIERVAGLPLGGRTVTLALTPTTAASLSTPDGHAPTHHSVVELRASNPLTDGTAFAFGRRGLLLTAAYVVQGRDRVHLKDRSGAVLEATVLAVAGDVAVLEGGCWEPLVPGDGPAGEVAVECWPARRPEWPPFAACTKAVTIEERWLDLALTAADVALLRPRPLGVPVMSGDHVIGVLVEHGREGKPWRARRIDALPPEIRALLEREAQASVTSTRSPPESSGIARRPAAVSSAPVPTPAPAPPGPPWRPVRVLHLSDLHFDEKTSWDADNVLGRLVKDVEKLRASVGGLDLVVVTGDVANRGKASEYATALSWLDGPLKAATGLGRERMRLVPGNHDVDRGAITRTARGLAANILEDKDAQQAAAEVLGDEGERAPLLQRKSAWQNLAREFHPGLQTPWWSEALTLGPWKVHLAGFDSALLSGSDQDRGRLLLSRWQSDLLLKGADEADLCVAMLHHPWDYLTEDDRGICEEEIRRRCGVILHGHLHQQKANLTSDPDRDVLQLAAGACYAGSGWSNSYQLLELDPGRGEARVHFRVWDGHDWIPDRNRYQKAPNGVATLPLRRSPRLPPEPAPPPADATAPEPKPARPPRNSRAALEARWVAEGRRRTPRVPAFLADGRDGFISDAHWRPREDSGTVDLVGVVYDPGGEVMGSPMGMVIGTIDRVAPKSWDFAVPAGTITRNGIGGSNHVSLEGAKGELLDAVARYAPRIREFLTASAPPNVVRAERGQMVARVGSVEVEVKNFKMDYDHQTGHRLAMDVVTTNRGADSLRGLSVKVVGFGSMQRIVPIHERPALDGVVSKGLKGDFVPPYTVPLTFDGDRHKADRLRPNDSAVAHLKPSPALAARHEGSIYWAGCLQVSARSVVSGPARFQVLVKTVEGEGSDFWLSPVEIGRAVFAVHEIDEHGNWAGPIDWFDENDDGTVMIKVVE